MTPFPMPEMTPPDTRMYFIAAGGCGGGRREVGGEMRARKRAFVVERFKRRRARLCELARALASVSGPSPVAVAGEQEGGGQSGSIQAQTHLARSSPWTCEKNRVECRGASVVVRTNRTRTE